MQKHIAVLDTDFMIKTFNTQNTANNRLIDIVLQLPYQFYCHTQNQLELSTSSGVSQWLVKQITQNNIKCLSDLDLINSIQTSYACSAHNAIHLYLMFLEQACSIFSQELYSTHYKDLENLQLSSITTQEFANALQQHDSSIGPKHNLGEIKDALLSLVLANSSSSTIILFCSDDKQARKALISFTDLFECISYMGFYWIAKSKQLLTQKQEQEFFTGWKTYCPSHAHNITIKQNLSSPKPDYKKINIDTLFDAIWSDTAVLHRDGFFSINPKT